METRQPVEIDVYLLRNSPARRDDFITVTGCILFPLKSCSTMWLEDVPVAESTADLEPHFQICYDTSSRFRRFSHSTMLCSIYRVRSHQQTITSVYALQIFFTHFLQKFQTGKPRAPFLREELHGLLKTIMAIFIKKSVMDQAITAAKIDIKDDKNRIDANKWNWDLL